MSSSVGASSAHRGRHHYRLRSRRAYHREVGARPVVLIAVLAACGGGGRQIVERQEVAPDPAWAAEYTAQVEAACGCRDAPCIRAKRPVLEAMLADHGGLDDAPASVHESKTQFKGCWKDIARDLALDLEEVADTICECKDTACAETYGEKLDAVVAKYSNSGVEGLHISPDATDESRAVHARIVGCVAAKTIPAADYLATIEAIADELCACQADDCTKGAIRKRWNAFPEYLFVGQDPALSGRIEAADKRMCKCMADALKRGVQVEMGPLKGTLSVRMTCE